MGGRAKRVTRAVSMLSRFCPDLLNSGQHAGQTPSGTLQIAVDDALVVRMLDDQAHGDHQSTRRRVVRLWASQ